MAGLIDVWDVDTFGEDLIIQLHANAELVRNYIATEQEIFLEREAAGLRAVYRSNRHAESYLRFLECLGQHMAARTIRAWHYTRLTDSEVNTLRRAGIKLSTLETTRQRLDAQVAAGQISVEIGNALFEASPLHDPQQLESRSNRFWMISHPTEVEDYSVTLLLANWGGEVVYFWLRAQAPHLQQMSAASEGRACWKSEFRSTRAPTPLTQAKLLRRPLLEVSATSPISEQSISALSARSDPRPSSRYIRKAKLPSSRSGRDIRSTFAD